MLNLALGVIREAASVYRRDRDRRRYQRWIREREPEAIRRVADRLPAIDACEHRPIISLVVPLFDTPEPYLRSMVESVRAQTYPEWELCMADDASGRAEVRSVARGYARDDARIKLVERPERGHISAASNSALALATGEFIALLDHDDTLHPAALERVVQTLNARAESDLVYTDEDKITEAGQRCYPIFKPEWNRVMFMAFNVINHLGVYRKSIIDHIQGFREGYEGSQDYDLALRFLEHTEDARIAHVPQVLYHWRTSEGSVASNPHDKFYAFVSGKKAVREHYERQGRQVRVGDAKTAILHKAYFPYIADEHSVTIVILPGTAEAVEEAIQDLVGCTLYTRFDIIAGINGGGYARDRCRGVAVRGLDATGLSTAEFCNVAARDAAGRYVVFVSPRLRVRAYAWLDEMVSSATAEDTRVVGGKIYGRRQRILSGGLVLGVGDDLAAPAWAGLREDNFGYCGRARVTQELSAVGIDCLLTDRETLDRLGGFNAAALGERFFDVDYCLHVRRDGGRVVWTPFAEFTTEAETLYTEAADAGGAGAYMRETWGEELDADPHYSPNLDARNACFEW